MVAQASRGSEFYKALIEEKSKACSLPAPPYIHSLSQYDGSVLVAELPVMLAISVVKLAKSHMKLQQLHQSYTFGRHFWKNVSAEILSCFDLSMVNYIIFKYV